MPTIPVYSLQGELMRQIDGPDALFGVAPNASMLHQVVVALSSARRRPLAKTKTRGMVRGGGRKPWKQKGTGRARHGSIRSPQWRGGGVVFGPTGEVNYAKQVNKAQKDKAFRMAVSDRVRDGQCAVVEGLPLEAGKTKVIAAVLKSLGTATDLQVSKGVLWMRSSSKDQPLARMARNIPRTWVAEAQNVGVEQVLQYPVLLFTPAGFEELSARYRKGEE